MPGMPSVLTDPPPPVDLLSELLAQMHLAGTVMFRAEFREPWSVDAPRCEELARMLPGQAGHLIPFHIVAAGDCWLDMPGREPVRLAEGDALVLPYGHEHRLRAGDATEAVPVAQLLPPPPWPRIPVVDHGGGGRTSRVICGFLQCDELLFHPLLHDLPPLLHVNPATAPADRWLAATVRHTADEASRDSPGSRTLLSRLTELMFVEILRGHMQLLSEERVGWFAACRDGVVGPALQRLHAAPMDDWTLEGLARQVGSSRSVLAERFRHLLGVPPIQYLARWRLHLAAQRLKSGSEPMKTVADEIGYESEAAFSRAFKRQFGLPPGEWRRRQ